jgi:hypothetical protein
MSAQPLEGNGTVHKCQTLPFRVHSEAFTPPKDVERCCRSLENVSGSHVSVLEAISTFLVYISLLVEAVKVIVDPLRGL